MKQKTQERNRMKSITAVLSLWLASGSGLMAAESSLSSTPAASNVGASFPVAITVHAGKPLGELKPIWRMFGADEPNYATMKDGKALLAKLGELRSNDVFFRAHNLLCTGDGSPALKWGSTGIYTEDRQGNPVYNWSIIDHIFDTYLERGVRPYAQVGFMPKALSVHPEPYQHEWRPGLSYGKIGTGWAYPPKDYEKWRELVYQWVQAA
jgi:xylan 1,4-beta-xylosidase